MCISSLGQIIYGAIMLVTLALTLTSMFTPGWNEYGNKTESEFKNLSIPSSMGIFPFACEIRKDDKPITTTPGYKDPCQEWWDNLTGWQKGVAAAMCLAVLVEIIALIWNIVTFCACCCKKYIIHPLVAFAFLIAILHLIALIIYGLKYKDQIDFKNLPKDPKNSNNLGYSFYMAIVAMIGAVLNIFVGGIAVHFAKRDL